MHISCPKCYFKRSVDSTQIPVSATVATCPKCESKFSFRDPETGNFIDEICLNVDDKNLNGSVDPTISSYESGSSEDLAGEKSAKSVNPLKDNAHASVENDKENDSDNTSQDINQELEDSAQEGTQESKSANESADENLSSDENLAHHEDPKTLREEDIKRHDNEDRDNPLRPPQENSYTQKKTGNEEYQMVTDDVPWEHPERYGIVGSLFQTIIRVMFRAPEFFSTIHSQSSALRPATFYALLGLFQTLCLQIWLSTFDNIEVLVNSPDMAEQISQFSTPMTIIMTPFISVFELLLFSAFLYLAIRITNPDQADYNLLLRVIAYAYAPSILSIIPYIGPLIGLIWFIVNIFVGVKFALRLTWQRTILALSPIFLLWLFIIVSSLSQRLG